MRRPILLFALCGLLALTGSCKAQEALVLKAEKAKDSTSQLRVVLKNDQATITPNIDDWQMIIIRQLQQDTRFENPKGSPFLGQELRIELSCDQPRHVTFGDKYREGSHAFLTRFPTTICEPAPDGKIPKVTYTLRYDESTDTWDLLAVNFETLPVDQRLITPTGRQ